MGADPRPRRAPARPVRAAALGLAGSLGLVLAWGLAPAEAPAQETSGVSVARHHGFPAAGADELAVAGLARIVEREDGVVRLSVAGSGTVAIRPGSPFVRRGDRTLQMANAPYQRGGRIWLPAELFVRLLSPGEDAEDGYVVRDGRLTRAPAGGATEATSSDTPPEVPTAELSSSGPFVVVIDPGHGGRDPGTQGSRGTDEKVVTLGIARKLRDRLEGVDGIRILMTRDRDTLVALRDRSRMAMAALNRTYDGQEPSGGLFVSIHANAVSRGHARGFETYFLGRATSERAREVAMRENSAIRYEEEGATPPPDDVRFMLADLDKTQWIIESNRLAGYTQNALRKELSTPDRGVKQANYLVLVWASGSMPSVLVEAGFLSTPDEARMLRSDAGQASVASALADAVRDYHRRYRQQITSTAARE